MKYISTRGGVPPADFTQVLMEGLAADGGLYVPESWPQLGPDFKPGSYIETAFAVMRLLVGGAIPDADLKELLNATYQPRVDGFQTPDVTPLKRLSPTLSVLELFHGPTLAFKDVALQLLGRTFDYQLRKTGQKITILGATSGDTGSAAIEGCRHAAGATIFILYPDGRPSNVQRRQMTSVNDPKVHALAIEGSFDDCQAIVKDLFRTPDFRQKFGLSSVNSINWVRIAAQVVYYVQAAYNASEPVTFVVPTGNFGNVYAAYAAAKMGAPIKRLIVASNRNDILTRFFETGTMKTSTVEPSLSPSMDIQVSSNFERLLFDLCNRNPLQLKKLMDDFKTGGSFSVLPKMLEQAQTIFSGVRCDDDQTLAAIAHADRDYGYLIDPHTAVGFHAYEMLKNALDGPVIILGCAHPSKFPDAVEKATGKHPALPKSLSDLFDRPERMTVLPNSAAVKDFIENH